MQATVAMALTSLQSLGARVRACDLRLSKQRGFVQQA